MKKVISFVTALLICVSLATAVLAEDTFVPSVPSKDAPEVVTVKDNDGKDVAGVIKDSAGKTTGYVESGKLTVTSVAEANTSTDISAEAKATLLDVYDKLSKGTMELPYGTGVDADKMVIKDLFDVTCDVQTNDSVELTFDIDVASTAKVVVMVYNNNTWSEVTAVKNNGNGTVTCTFEKFGAVAIAIPADANKTPSETGDNSDLMLWTVLLTASAVAVVVLVTVRRRSMMSK